ncbi:type II TA system antitoxin MqsA family protein [Sulfuriferula thiophila]|uniref:type II TA system antitoxin MqsA family protein n=1 Tax=Sulfuriferula thiophila TaxID=1781211 RepID=UPI000F60FBCD|nr:type II TA system antitoxin MqsA family protein [Sulfuriferula thiophila]
MNAKKFCLQCDDGTALEYGVKDLSVTVNGVSAVVTSVSGWHCPACGECQFDDGEGKRYSEALATLRKTVNEQRADNLRVIRRKLKLNQAEAGRLFGGGVSAFSEYERGKTQPPKSTVLLLKLLDKHPELLEEIRTA